MQTTGLFQKPFDGGPAKPQPEPKRPAPPQLKTVKLTAANGMHFDNVEIRADRNLPECIVWGIADRQRVFVRDGKNYREASFIVARMPMPRTF